MPIDQTQPPGANRLCALANVDIPIIQAPMTYIAGAQLAAAVSNAGALGIIETTSEQDRADVQRVHDLTDRPVGANIALLFNRNPAVVDLLSANNIRFVTTSAGDPSLFTARLHDAGITVFHVVGTLAAAKKAVDAGVDGLVVEGVEGGGFKNRFGASTMVLLPLVAAHVDVPIVAAGGICDARSMAAALVLGADGVQMGTRLLASAGCQQGCMTTAAGPGRAAEGCVHPCARVCKDGSDLRKYTPMHTQTRRNHAWWSSGQSGNAERPMSDHSSPSSTQAPALNCCARAITSLDRPRRLN
ncbi:MAG: enoyl-[acyl-carrier protein] reductase [Mycobacterium sp.]|nr:enoyl-[acyl-carrier protein] reductase [Mycobacterium sp.]